MTRRFMQKSCPNNKNKNPCLSAKIRGIRVPSPEASLKDG